MGNGFQSVIKRFINVLIVAFGFFIAQSVYANHIYTAINMEQGELILINAKTDDIIIHDLKLLSGWPLVNMLQHTWITKDEKTIFLSTDAMDDADALIIRLGIIEINWATKHAVLEIEHIFKMDPASTPSHFPAVHQINENQPIPAWTHSPITALHGPTFLPHSNFSYISHLTDNRQRGINIKTNELVAVDPMSFDSKSKQTHGINFNARGRVVLGTGYFFDSNEIDVYEANNHTGKLKLKKSIKLGTDHAYAAYTHYIWWLDNRYALTASMQHDATSLTPAGATIIGPSVWLLDSDRGTAKKIIGTADNENGDGIWRSPSDLNVANDKLYVAEESSIGKEAFGTDGFISIFNLVDIHKYKNENSHGHGKNGHKPKFIKRLKPGKELPSDFRIAHSLVTTVDERFVYVTSYASNYIIKIDTDTDEVVKIYGTSDGLNVPHGAFISGRDR